jgi:hypothetical protein
MALNFNNIQIDEELENLLPPLSKEDYDLLEQSLLKNGFEQKFGRIKVWFGSEEDTNNESVGYIVDGHNRYRICQKHKIELNSWCFEVVFMDSKEEVIKWMFENQLARRNLSQTEKYEIVERYTTFLNDMAKKNQSDGGKGLSNLTKVNVRQEKAKRAGMSDGNYYKLDKIMKSDNEEVKQKLREKKISVDKAYREIKNQKPTEKESITPEQKIIEFDNRMNEIDKEISSLRTERELLMRRRSSLFEALDIPCELKYEFIESVSPIDSRDCRFYIEIDGYKQVFVECSVLFETPFATYTSQVPEKYKNDFLMLYKKAYFEEKEHYNRTFTEWYEKNGRNNEAKLTNDSNKDKEFYKKCFRILAKNFHPDNGDGNIEDMQCLNQLKVMWGI